MNKIEISTCATWELSQTVIGDFTTPLMLQIDIKNNTDKPVQIHSICVSIKYNYILFVRSKDILKRDFNFKINQYKNYSIQMNIRYLFNQYSNNKKFKVKLFTNIGVYESDIIDLDALRYINKNKKLIKVF